MRGSFRSNCTFHSSLRDVFIAKHEDVAHCNGMLVNIVANTEICPNKETGGLVI